MQRPTPEHLLPPYGPYLCSVCERVVHQDRELHMRTAAHCARWTERVMRRLGYGVVERAASEDTQGASRTLVDRLVHLLALAGITPRRRRTWIADRVSVDRVNTEVERWVPRWALWVARVVAARTGSGHARLTMRRACRALRCGPGAYERREALFALVLEGGAHSPGAWDYVQALGVEEPLPTLRTNLTLYLERDTRWRDKGNER